MEKVFDFRSLQHIDCLRRKRSLLSIHLHKEKTNTYSGIPDKDAENRIHETKKRTYLSVSGNIIASI
jgi:hypothetical protein